MNQTDLTQLMRGATDGLEPPPDFAAQVLRGGRRRRLRRRLAAVASAVVVATTAVVASVVVPADSPPVADERLLAPTKGDLAGDQAFLGEAVAAWKDGLSRDPEAATGKYDDRRGEPHVWWAGNTPAGRAAIVLQEINVHEDAQVPAGETGTHTAEGLVAIDPEDGKLKLVSTRAVGEEQLGYANFYKFGPEDRTMLVVDEGKPLYYTHDFAYEIIGEYGNKDKLEWSPVEPHDGVALVSIPNNVNEIVTVAYQGNRPPDVVDWTKIRHDFYSRQNAIASRYLPRRLTDPTFRTSFLPWKQTWELGAPLGMSPAELDRLRGVDDNLLVGGSDFVGQWTIFAKLGDNRVIILQEVQSRDGTPTLLLLVANPPDNAMTTDPVGPIDRSAVLPVKFHITNGEGGWIVARLGKSLSYRTAPDGQWTDAGKDAALLPDNAIEVKVGDDVVTL